MFATDKKFLGYLSEIDNSELLVGKVGIEKECLRINGSNLSLLNHPSRLGSSLFNQHITTDFCEALLEFVTPPHENKNSIHSFLEDIHHFTYKSIDENLWPFSMPPCVNDNEIIIADYGKSNLGLLKRYYREGLAMRYGKQMQIIAGLHFNYSFPDKILEIYEKKCISDGKDFSKSDFYLGVARNIQRYNWIILYLFGASPVIPSNLINQTDGFKKLNDEYCYLPYSTSLRMSNVGYQSKNQEDLSVSLNELDCYISDLLTSTQKESDNYEALSKEYEGLYKQLNSNILQIEDEHYSSCRPKSNNTSKKRMLWKLKNFGIDYLEFRSVDINPFERSGIDSKSIKFLEIFMITCALTESPLINITEANEIRNRDDIVAKMGRKKHLSLEFHGKNIQMKDQARKFLEQMNKIVNLTDTKDNSYSESIMESIDKFMDPSLTLSSKVLDRLDNEKMNFTHSGISIAEEHRSSFENYSNKSMNLLLEEADASMRNFIKNENDDHFEFKDFLNSYLEM